MMVQSVVSARREEVVDTPSIAGFPDDLERLAEWRRWRAEKEREPTRDPGGKGEPRDPESPAEARLMTTLEDETVRSILEEARNLRPKDRRLLLGIARQIVSPANDV